MRYYQRQQAKCNFCMEWFQVSARIGGYLNVCAGCVQRALTYPLYIVPNQNDKIYRVFLVAKVPQLQGALPQAATKAATEALQAKADALLESELHFVLRKWAKVKEQLHAAHQQTQLDAVATRMEALAHHSREDERGVEQGCGWGDMQIEGQESIGEILLEDINIYCNREEKQNDQKEENNKLKQQIKQNKNSWKKQIIGKQSEKQIKELEIIQGQIQTAQNIEETQKLEIQQRFSYQILNIQQSKSQNKILQVGQMQNKIIVSCSQQANTNQIKQCEQLYLQNSSALIIEQQTISKTLIKQNKQAMQQQQISYTHSIQTLQLQQMHQQQILLKQQFQQQQQHQQQILPKQQFQQQQMHQQQISPLKLSELQCSMQQPSPLGSKQLNIIEGLGGKQRFPVSNEKITPRASFAKPRQQLYTPDKENSLQGSIRSRRIASVVSTPVSAYRQQVLRAEKEAVQEQCEKEEQLRRSIQEWLREAGESVLLKIKTEQVYESVANTKRGKESLELVRHCLDDIPIDCYLHHLDFASVKVVKMVKNSITTAQFALILARLYRTEVETLVVTNNALTEDIYEVLIRSRRNKLKKIYLGNNHFVPKKVKPLWKQLEKVYIIYY